MHDSQLQNSKQKCDTQPMYGVIYVHPLVEWWKALLEEYHDTVTPANVPAKLFKPLFDLKSKGFLNDIPKLSKLQELVADSSSTSDDMGEFALLFNEKEAILNNREFLTEVLDVSNQCMILYWFPAEFKSHSY